GEAPIAGGDVRDEELLHGRARGESVAKHGESLVKVVARLVALQRRWDNCLGQCAVGEGVPAADSVAFRGARAGGALVLLPPLERRATSCLRAMRSGPVIQWDSQ
ncbi:MAG: hypothetical protein MUQ10_11920, partial [Anaerolineae bacterium]|nr:hypothetical protein [Anaerolineae bacterium]